MTKPSIYKIVSLVLVSLFLVSAIAFSGYYYFKYSFNAGNKEVVDFKEMTKEEISQYLIDNSIKEEYVIFEEAYDEEIEEGKVISQSIEAGEGKFKDVVTIVISKGFDPNLEIELPDITDFMQTDIEKWFEENHFSNVSYEFIVPEDSDEEIPYGKVIALSKIGLAKRSEEITVSLADEKLIEEETDNKPTSGNEEDNYVTIVDFKGYSLEKFVDWVHSRGLKYYVYEVYSDDYKKGEVMSQSPKAGEKAKKGSTVTLRMSLGQAKKLDNLVGKTEADAKKYADENGLKLKVNEEYNRNVEKGKIVSTTPAAGKNYTEGDTLTITVSKGSDVIAFNDSYVGKAESELLNAVKAKYSGATFAKTELYSDKEKGLVISHDSQISLLNKFAYSLSLGQYSDSYNYAGKSLSDVQAVVNSANNKGASISLSSSEEITTVSSNNNKIKSCTFANKKYTCVVYKYQEPSSTFVASDFQDKKAGQQTYSKDGNSYNITVNITYTDYNDAVADSFNSAICSTGNIIKNGSVVTVVLNKGPKPIEYGKEIVDLTYKSCQIPDDTATYDAVVSKVMNVLTTSSGYSSSQIQTIPTDSKLVGYIDIENSSKGKFVIGTDAIVVYIGSAPRGQ